MKQIPTTTNRTLAPILYPIQQMGYSLIFPLYFYNMQRKHMPIYVHATDFPIIF